MSDVIHTERLVLRPLMIDDVSVLVRGFNDEAVVKWLEAAPQPFAASDVKLRNEDGSSRWPNVAVIEHEGQMIGSISGQPQFGYWLLQEAWGRGFATEAGHSMVRCTFEDSNTDHLSSGFFEGNRASENVLTKLGFSKTGREMRWCNPRRASLPFVAMRLERADWEAQACVT